MAPQFGTDGVRGLANRELTPDVAVALGRAAVDVLLADQDKKLVTIGRDTRKSGWMLQAGVLAGAASAGADVELLDVVPTPAVAWASAERRSLGVMISASHNPFADNGVKLFAPGGLKLDDNAEATVQARYLELLQAPEPTGSAPTGARIGTVVETGGIDGWVDSVAGSISGKLDFSVVVDGAHGSAYTIGPKILRALGARVVEIGADPNGTNINDGYGSTSPERLQKEVLAQQADVGIGFDGDADRLIVVDHNGTCIDGDRVIAILAADWKSRQLLSDDTVVVTVMTNLGFHRAMEQQGISVITTGVGDRYVLEELDRGGFSLGGEQSGHIICRDVASTGDGILSAIQLLDAVQRSGKTLADVASSVMTTVPQILRNVSLTTTDVDVAEALKGPIADVEATFGSSGRVLVRASGTEPLLRIMVEHLDATIADQACTSLVDAAHKTMDTPPN